jgi:hypothetical protein
MTAEAAKDGDDMCWGLVCLINNDHAAKPYSAKEWRISILEDTLLQRRGKHQLVHRCVTMELNVFARATQELGMRSL